MPRKKASKRTAKPSGRAKARSGQSVAGQLRRIVDLQQRAIGRSAQFASGVAKKVSEGNYNLAHWVNDYSSFWSGMATDVNQTMQAMFDDSAPKAAKSTTAAEPSAPTDSYRNWLSLQRSVFSRVADYYHATGQLVAAQSVDPRDWIERCASLWSDVTGDVGDWMQREAGETLRPTAEWMRRYRIAVRQGNLTQDIPLDIPLESFPDQVGGDPEVTLLTEGVKRVGGGVELKSDQVLPPDQILSMNVMLHPAKVRRSQPHTSLRLCDLPASLNRGDVYTGLVWARAEGKRATPVAAIDIVIV